MFTGIVEARTRVRRIEPQGTGIRLWLPAPEFEAGEWRVSWGDSIAVCGACLTVAGLAPPGSTELVPESTEPPAGHDMLFELSRETLERTWFAGLEPGRLVNLERAARIGDRLDGHLVSGHVDGGGELYAVEDAGDGGKLFRFEVAEGLERYLIEKGSVCLDGVSLTVCEPQGRRFHVALIPLTLDRTNLGEMRPGTPVNVEVDMVGKWIERLMPAR